ncbi:MAG: acyltransferase [Muribaculaceae bacterium]|nr:acyltransferase [Muribaculaceae bacterium]
MKLIDLNCITEGRSLFMGLAILWIIAVHYSFLYDTPIGLLFKNGYLGVDIFIMLSAFGLCFSLSKGCSYIEFIKKRLKRIIPTWWVLISICLIINILLENNHPQNLFQFLCYYSGIGWWFFHNEPYGIYYYEWYIPTLLLFYIFTPLLYKLSNTKIITIYILSIICAVTLLRLGIDNRLSLSYERIPTFISGIILFKIWKGDINNKISIPLLYLFSIIGIIGIICFLGFGILGPLYKHCFTFSLPLLLTLCNLLIKGILVKIISFIGSLTLELYLLHIYDLPLTYIMNFIENRTIAIIITTIILIGIAYVINKSIEKITTFIVASKS